MNIKFLTGFMFFISIQIYSMDENVSTIESQIAERRRLAGLVFDEAIDIFAQLSERSISKIHAPMFLQFYALNQKVALKKVDDARNIVDPCLSYYINPEGFIVRSTEKKIEKLIVQQLANGMPTHESYEGVYFQTTPGKKANHVKTSLFGLEYSIPK